MKTKVFYDEFKGHKLFAVWEIDDSGAKLGNYPLVSFGGNKALAVVKHMEELKEYVATVKVENEKKGKR